MLKLKLQYFWLPNAKSRLIRENLMLGKIEGRSRKGQQRIRLLGGITYSMDMSLSKLLEIMKDRGVWCATVHRSQIVRHR